MKLTNSLYTDLEVDWERPVASRFLQDQPVVVMLRVHTILLFFSKLSVLPNKLITDFLQNNQ